MFCVFAVGWLFLASFSTTKEIFGNNLLASGLHPENYVKAWVNNNISRCFLNSLIYASVSCVFVIFIAAPAAYVIAKNRFRFRSAVRALFVVGMSIPSIMIVIPMYAILIRMGMVGKIYIEHWEYGNDCQLCKVRQNGYFSFEGQGYFLSEAFRGKYIAVRDSHLPGQITLLFRQFRIGRIDREKRVFTTKRISRLAGDPRENV